MKVVIALAAIILAVMAALRFFLAHDPFLIKVYGVVMLLFGAVVLFAFSSLIEDKSSGAMEVSGALIIAGAITILFI
ncbi:MAG: hypothetical protein FJY76_02740 [Candidatus Aenigmarchaeota archaeon]|nr:hypothetical protein [Candidatus Aenigmarchaeota archaeon]